MTTEQLREILDDKTRKISKQELVNVIYELKHDVIKEHLKEIAKDKINKYNAGYYSGEMNAFYIALELIEHLT